MRGGREDVKRRWKGSEKEVEEVKRRGVGEVEEKWRGEEW